MPSPAAAPQSPIPNKNWERFTELFFHDSNSGISLDISAMHLPPEFLSGKGVALMERAHREMDAILRGEIVNDDEKQQVGHYWLRNSALAPIEYRGPIETALLKIKEFAQRVHSGAITAPSGEKFDHLLVVGIGGSALGPQLLNQAFVSPEDRMRVSFFDNTDPDGMNTVLDSVPHRERCLVLVISKSGGTKETRNGQLVAKSALGLNFAKQFVAVTRPDSVLDRTAVSEGWLDRFPMWDWVGGRTSVLSAVGLLPAALQGINIDELLRGARDMDTLTSSRDLKQNPAALLSLMWYHAGGGRGEKDMVVLPYKDRLLLLSRYLQQLVMESLGKQLTRDKEEVHQGLAVYGNKGSTDQHAYVQQLRDGINNFFAVFLNVLKNDSGFTAHKQGLSLRVEDEYTSGDYLSGFLLGTRRALEDKGRKNAVITVPEVSPYYLGMLIALFERAVGNYAAFVNINAYHQPGVEAGKVAAGQVLALQTHLLNTLAQSPLALGLDELMRSVPGDARYGGFEKDVFYTLQYLAANNRIEIEPGNGIFERRYRIHERGPATPPAAP